ncbi:MAG: hypothetical protein ACSHYA_00175 [Opitutaceae bacterium]
MLGCSFLGGQSRLENHAFEVFERVDTDEGNKLQFQSRSIVGNERQNNSLNRLSMRSERQSDYPVPMSSCGPTAMLNILIWYEKYGLIEPFARDADVQDYKLNFFNEIDRRLTEDSGFERTDDGGTPTYSTMIVMDEMVNELSAGRLRMHTKRVDAPLKLSDFHEIMPNFRTGYLTVRTRDDLTNRMSSGYHAVTFIRADRAGYITLGTWGKMYRGILKMKNGDQWFIPSNPEHRELQIVNLIQLIPFEPINLADRSQQ